MEWIKAAAFPVAALLVVLVLRFVTSGNGNAVADDQASPPDDPRNRE